MQIKRSWRLILAIGLAAGASTVAHAQSGPVTVHLANGDALPLQEAKLTYEYQMWAKDTPRALAPFKYSETTVIVLGKERYPVAGTRISFDHSQGRVRLDITQADGKKKEIKKVKTPERKVLLPDLDKDFMVQIRSLDIKGQTLTGSRRSFCLISFTSHGGVRHRSGVSGGPYRVLALASPRAFQAARARALGEPVLRVIIRIPRWGPAGSTSQRGTMGRYGTNEFRGGLKVMQDGHPCNILENQFVKPGKGQAFNRVKMRDLITGRVLERTFKSGETVEAADVVETDMQFLYSDGEHWHFMVQDTFEQFAADAGATAEAKSWLKEEDICQVTLYNGTPLSVVPPKSVNLRGHGVGARRARRYGDGRHQERHPRDRRVTVKVPLFVEEGELLKINTRTGEYISRVKG